MLYGTDHVDGAAASETEAHPAPRAWAVRKVLELYEGKGRGAELAATKGTSRGLLSAMTEYVDHERRARSREYRLDSAWFGQGAVIKQRALDHAISLTA